MSPPLRASFQFPQYLFKGSLVDPRLRATFSPAHPLARQDVPLAQASTFLSYAFREQEDDQAALTIFLRPRVARAQGTHRAIPPCWRTFSASC
jgi:hypothetical protein